MIDVDALRESAQQARDQATAAKSDEQTEREQSPDVGVYDDVLRRRAEERMAREPGADRERRRLAGRAAASGGALALLFGLADRPHGRLALLPAAPVQDQDAVQVVHLVLDHAGLEA